MKPKDIAIALTDLLKTVLVTNGYNTDVGQRVYRGKLKLDEDKIPCVVIGEADDVVKGEATYGKSVLIEQSFVLDAYVKCDPDNPNDAAHDAIEDLKKVMFTGSSVTKPGGSLAPLVKSMKYVSRHIGPRPDGSDFVLGSITIQVTYSENMVE